MQHNYFNVYYITNKYVLNEAIWDCFSYIFILFIKYLLTSYSMLGSKCIAVNKNKNNIHLPWV